MSAKGQKRTFSHLFDHLVRRWLISSSQGDRNSHQRGADDYHCKTRWPGPKAGITRKNHSAKKQGYHRNSIGDSQRHLRIVKDEKGNHDRKGRQNYKDTNAQCTQPVAPGQSRARFGSPAAGEVLLESSPAAGVEKLTPAAGGAHLQWCGGRFHDQSFHALPAATRHCCLARQGAP